MAKLTKDAFIEALKEMTILEVKELVDAMKSEFGVDPSAVAAAAPAASGAEEGPTEVNVILTSVGPSKVAVIKAVKAITGLGLKDAKAVVDAAPAPIKEGIKPEEAQELKAQLEEAGATVEIK